MPAEKEWWAKRRVAIEAELLSEPAVTPVAGAAAKAASTAPVRSEEAAIVDTTNKSKKKVAAKK